MRRHGFIAPRTEYFTISKGSTSAHSDAENTVVPEDALHSGEDRVDAVVRGRAPNTFFVATLGAELIRGDSDANNPVAREAFRARVGCQSGD